MIFELQHFIVGLVGLIAGLLIMYAVWKMNEKECFSFRDVVNNYGDWLEHKVKKAARTAEAHNDSSNWVVKKAARTAEAYNDSSNWVEKEAKAVATWG